MNLDLFKPILLCGVLIFTGCKSTPDTAKQTADKQAELREINQHFSYRGQRINPRAVKDMTCWLSDRFPGPVAICMEGTDHSNRYFGDVRQNNGWVESIWPLEDSTKASQHNAFFSYKYIGRLNNGLHVLHIAMGEGGSGVFESLLLIKFTIEDAYWDDNDHKVKLGQRIVMHQVGEIALGDRVNAKLKINGNSVLLTRKGIAPQEIKF